MRYTTSETATAAADGLASGATVEITIIDLATGSVVPLTSSGCTEIASDPGTFRWRSSDLATQPTSRVEYLFRMQEISGGVGRFRRGKLQVGGYPDEQATSGVLGVVSGEVTAGFSEVLASGGPGPWTTADVSALATAAALALVSGALATQVSGVITTGGSGPWTAADVSPLATSAALALVSGALAVQVSGVATTGGAGPWTTADLSAVATAAALALVSGALAAQVSGIATTGGAGPWTTATGFATTAALALVAADVERMYDRNVRTRLWGADSPVVSGAGGAVRNVPADASSHMEAQVKADVDADWSSPVTYYVEFGYEANVGSGLTPCGATPRDTAPTDGTFSLLCDFPS